MAGMVKLNFLNRTFIIKLLALALISWIYLYRAFHDFETPYVKGDGFEYVLMTEGIRNHFTPNITYNDVLSFKQRFSKCHSWEHFFKRDYIDHFLDYLKNSKAVYNEQQMGFYANKSGNWYSYHFWFYSYLNLPAYVIGSHYGPVRPFYFTNAILVIVTCILILFFTPFSTFNSILAALCFCFSAAYWYLGWQHTEVLTMSLVVAGLIFYFREKYTVSLILIALSCLQNQPLILLLGFMAVIIILKKGINVKNILKVGGLCCIALLPPFFYFVNYHSTNLIKDAGYLDTKYITFNRVTGFFFDLNQGVILTIPFILLTYIFLIATNLIKMGRRKISFDPVILLPLVIILIACSISTMGNWNHGMAIINRYASWMSAIIMIHTFYLLNNYPLLTSTVVFNYFFVTQAITTLYHQKFNNYDWSSNRHTPAAKWAFRKFPELYNPDPYIFAIRTQPNSTLTEESSPYIYLDDNVVRKVMVNKNKVEDLVNFGVSKEDIEKIKTHTKFNFGWGFVDLRYFNTKLSGQEIANVMRERKIQAAYYKIMSSSVWVEQIKQKAKEWNMTFEQVLRLDAEYVVNEDEKAENIQ